MTSHAVLGRRRRLSSLYYGIIDDALSREALAVSAGRARYYRDCEGSANSYFLLRRNIHRLEKGLVMRPRKAVFAVEYIDETLAVFARLHVTPDRTESEYQWARAVLSAYFQSVDHGHGKIAAAYKRFVELTGDDSAQPAPYIPYPRGTQPPPVTIKDFLSLSIRRRSVRWFLPEPVPRDLVDKALEAAAQAPSACNRQPFSYRIFDDPPDAARIANLALGTKGFVDNINMLAVLVGRLRAYPEARDRHAVYIDGALSSMAFMYGLETVGLASCPINWPDIEPQESAISGLLNLEPDERVIMLIAIGKPDPDGLIPFSAKRPLSQFRSYEDLC